MKEFPFYALVTPRPDVPDKTMPDGARRSQMEPDGARHKNCCFCLTSWTRRFQEFLGTDCARRHQIFLFVYLTEGTDWLVSGVPGVKEADRNGQKRSGSVWHGFVWHGWSWCNQSTVACINSECRILDSGRNYLWRVSLFIFWVSRNWQNFSLFEKN